MSIKERQSQERQDISAPISQRTLALAMTELALIGQKEKIGRTDEIELQRVREELSKTNL